jgi:penicillin-binding protein 2
VIGTVRVLQAAIPGADVHLSIDIDYQYAAEAILADELRLARQREACKGCEPHVAEAGSMVALDVTDGSVVALASLPTFDPADFIFGISSEQFGYLRDRPDQPFLDRSTQGLYPAGSTFKPVTAFAAIESGARGEFTRWVDEGRHTLANCTDTELAGCVFRNAGDARLGAVDLRRAIELSSDTYFYSLGELFWVQQDTYGETIIQDWATRFGFGAPTGIQLPSEQKGRVPTPENVEEELDLSWYTGDNVNLAIGQGYLLVTPLQLTNAYAQLATGGIRYQPRLVTHLSAGDPTAAVELPDQGVLQEFLPRIATDAPLPGVPLSAVRDGLVAVNRSGTAVDAFTGFPLDQFSIAGKTGTAEVYNKADYSLYAGFGPMSSPKYAVAAVLEEAGFGGDAAAPAVRRFFEILSGTTPVPTAPLVGETGAVPVRPELPDSRGVGGEVGGPTVDGQTEDSTDEDTESEPSRTTATTPRSTTSAVPTTPTSIPPTSATTVETVDPTASTTTAPTTTPPTGASAQGGAAAGQRRAVLSRFPP